MLDPSCDYDAYAVRVYYVFESSNPGKWGLYLYDTWHASIRSYVVQWPTKCTLYSLPHLDYTKEGDMNADDVANHLTSLVRGRVTTLAGSTGRCYGFEVSNLGVM